MTGRIALACAQRGGRSYLARIRHEGLSRVSRPQRAGDAAHLVMAHLGPGVMGGDRYGLDVIVDADASLVLTGQMATPVYARHAPSSLAATWQVAAGGSLVVRGEPVMLDAGAQHEMRTTVDVAGDGCALLADIVTVAPGALARVRTTARIDGRLVVRDACDLTGFAGAIATVIVVCADAARRKAIAAVLAPHVADARDVRGGLGATSGAVIVRAMSERVWALQRLIDRLMPIAPG